MDAATLSILLARIVGLGVGVHKGLESDGITTEDAKALQAILDTGGGLLARKRTTDKPIGAIQLALIAKAFGEALGRHWAFNEQMVPARSHLPDWVRSIWSKPRVRRHQELEARIKMANLTTLSLGDKSGELLSELQQLTSQPTNSPYYQALWEAFTNPDLDLPGREPPISLEKSGDAREFEFFFRQAYIAALSTVDGQRVQRWKIELASEKPAALRRELMEDMAGWGRRHVLGNALRRWSHDALPFMPLDKVYIEPLGRLTTDSHATPTPIKGLLNDLLSEHHLVIVKAGFGHGKSLTARSLAKELAENWLSNNCETGSRLPAPVFIKCSRDILGNSYDHRNSVRRALYYRAREALGVDLPRTDEVFAPPTQEQRTIFILDGLDELSWGQAQFGELFTGLDEEVRGTHRAIVFTRPGALDERGRIPTGTPIIELLEFDEPRVNDWVVKWNALPGQERPIRLDNLTRDLVKIARIPILLLMIAITGQDLNDELQLTDLYTLFFMQIARGKLQHDDSKHHPIHEASDKLLACLSERRILKLEPATDPDERDSQRVEAMLWLMSRVAWAAHERAYRENPVPLRIREIDVYILDSELGLSEDVRTTIEFGLILTLQIDPAKGAHEILFGHKSFREFLVAYFWNHELRRRVNNYQDASVIDSRLAKARLLQPDDASFSMLQDLLKNGRKEELYRIHIWAQQVANQEALSTRKLRTDSFSTLREAALGVGSSIRPLKLANEKTLRSLLAWFDVQGYCIQLNAPRLISRRAYLVRVNLGGANLEGANLEGANLEGSHLNRINLKQAGASRIRVGKSRARIQVESPAVEQDRISKSVAVSEATGSFLEGLNLRVDGLEVGVRDI